MASLTIRNLPAKVKEILRIRAAQNGVSMEEEARRLLSNFTTPTISSSQASPVEMQSLQSKSILLIIGGSIAAYKALDLIRRLQERGARLNIIMTKAAQEFITPLAAEALSGRTVYSDLFSREEEHDIGHIRLARDADLIILAPATANRIAKIATGRGEDLADCVLLAARCPLLIAPAMNPAMWTHPTTVRNVAQLCADGVYIVGPEIGKMAERNESGLGRLSEPLTIIAAAEALLNITERPLSGRHFIVTSGPTHEPIDPVRYLANRSSGKQGHAIAKALANLGAKITLICGPVDLADPPQVKTIHVETACQMLQTVQATLPADGAIFVAAVCDWRSQTPSLHKIKKSAHNPPPSLQMVKNPDILATIGHASNRPPLVIGFAAETCDLIANAQKKCVEKGANFILANNITLPDGKNVMGADTNQVYLVSRENIEQWPHMSKQQIAQKLASLVVSFFCPSSAAHSNEQRTL
ncbi:bifunctional phosphopantothenoylcysteine decarboxylase/phosphopantothenate--cysteine ligase CoaBC [Bartonella henselae]|uniref:bifunctional phosphopantothenoylcysteine decarboxylase/phosphopantothenate--cysteine ligase CoaBC n=1 Tax=Bartonella henselae TaxID=38323 RepID=UPI00095BDA98|nr:bifunctional phosphopantothenoylcysteine decarboxylase/phosphopantothenate--cysteine ligase CoaBC [Bartonella henselae]OLL52914.1 bifunctional phosphopantothenoylcysteine decarboxylase/phosphopantothenate synthase [Bartonella henselae]OLL56240.1 bifunctional phosphopantothenoylcysteine decarboxylase/phosphopantothenate synthase [Bartonella henselae]UJM32466.1 bifunctional phosphopantothenoylcysteine decarboxylase/phosphopantothenate--cysteine ligase CoaBC [Bartonella henselae]